MGFKSPFNTDVLPMLRFPWACMFSEKDEVVFVDSHLDWERRECASHLIGDLYGQTKLAIERLNQEVAAVGLTLHDVARTEVTLSADVKDDQLPELFEMLRVFPGEVEVNYAESSFFWGRQQKTPEKLITIEVMLVR
ncbi:hypothetical protein MD588_06285 [Photobacterium sp. SDRW27]|uniref:hypothetical protein n=1 Tax=Photobacterium obscurum TaxID=2829490 RepID=UPI0022432409|nr:hypothetical protein [Photobacterium obscurum]MCW8328413.1 hypothetical protein [Photobacterium obscurum]